MKQLFFLLICCSFFQLIPAQPVNSETEDKEMSGNQVKAFISNGYKAFISMGVLAGPAENLSATPYSVLVTHSYTVHSNINVGLLTGYELLNEGTSPLGVKVHLTEAFEHRILYIGASGGYSYSLEKPINQNIEKAYGGFFLNPEVGVVIPFSAKNSFYMALGFRYNELDYKRQDWRFGTVDRTIYFKRASLKFGVVLY